MSHLLFCRKRVWVDTCNRIGHFREIVQVKVKTHGEKYLILILNKKKKIPICTCRPSICCAYLAVLSGFMNFLSIIFALLIVDNVKLSICFTCLIDIVVK